MVLAFESDVPPEVTGLMLCKVVGDDCLRIAEGVQFENGRAAVMTVLNRANICGHVGGCINRSTRFWADLLDVDGNTVGEIQLSRGSWNSLKKHWIRCKMQHL